MTATPFLLHGDPYDLPALLAALLQAKTDGNEEQAQQGFAILRRMAVNFAIIGALRQLEAGKLVCHAFAGRYWLCAPNLARSALQAADGDLLAALNFGKEQLQLAGKAPLIIFINPGFAAMSLAIFDLPGASCLQFPQSLLDSGKLRRWLWHEIGHCHLRCSQRFLDEGVATWFEYSHEGQFDLTAATSAAGTLPDLRQVLQSGFSQGLTFEDEAQDEAQRAAFYPQAALLIADLYARLGADGLSQLFAGVRANPQQAPELVLSALGEQAQRWQCTPEINPESAPVSGLTQEQVRALLAKGDTDGLASLLGNWGQVHDLPGKLALIDANLSLRELRAPQAEDKLREADAMLDDIAKHNKSLAVAELQLRQTMARLVQAKTVFERAGLGTRAMREADAILRQYPDSCPAQIGKASLLIHTPPQYGGDPDGGRSMLRKVALRPDDHGKVASAIFRHVFGQPVQPESTPAPESAPVAEMEQEYVPQGEVLLHLQGMRFGQADSFTLQVDELKLHGGEMLGVIGANGAGKSLLLECCIGLQEIQAKSHKICGQPFNEWQAQLSLRAQVGARLHRLSFEPGYLVSEIVKLLRAAYKHQDQALYQRLGLAALAGKKYGVLSSGQKQRVDLFAAFFPPAKLLLLDEPTLGLDDEFSQQLLNLIDERRQQGVAVLAVSHDSHFLARCQQIAIVANGGLQACASLSTIKKRYLAEYRVDLKLDAANRRHLGAFAKLGASHLVERSESLSLLGNHTFLQAFRDLAGQLDLLDYQVRACDLSDLFMVAGSLAPSEAESS